MVRLKHRYLLVNILYPESATDNPKDGMNNSSNNNNHRDIPDIVQFRQPSSDKLTPQLLAKIVREGVAELFGDYGSGMIAGSLVVKYLSPATSTAIIRVSRDHYRLAWAALTLITKLPRPIDQSCVVQVVRVSGTIRKAEEEAIRRAKASILRAQRKRGGDAGVVLGKMLGEEEESKDVEMSGVVDDDEDDEDEDEED